ncbi:PE family protein [Mycobacterium tuberculosis]
MSAAIAALFGSHGQHYQAISAQVAAWNGSCGVAKLARLRGRRSGQRNTACRTCSMRSTHRSSLTGRR